MLLRLNPYRIAINPSILATTAEDFLTKADKPENLAAHLGWDPNSEILVKGFAPFKDSKRLLSFMKENAALRNLKAARQAKGFNDFVSPRKGLKGWVQKTFSDAKEVKLKTSFDAFEWLNLSPRYLLLVSLHDALISYISTSEPRPVDLKESTAYCNPIQAALYKKDAELLNKVHVALSCPLNKVSPDTLIDCFSGYVLHYDRKKSTSYYLS